MPATPESTPPAFQLGGPQFAILEALATGRPLRDVLEMTVDAVEARLSGAVCSILLMNPDGRTLSFGAGRRLESAYTALGRIPVGPGAGSCGAAAYRRGPVIVEDTETDPLWDDFRDFARANRLRAAWSFPLFASQQQGADGPIVIGTFAVYRDTPSRPAAEWQSDLRGTAYLAGLAIERDLALQSVRDNEARYRTLSEHSYDAMFVHDNAGNVIDMNTQACRSLGYTREELIGMSPHVFDPDFTPAQMVALGIALDAHQAVTFETRHLRKDGTVFPVEVRIGPFLRESRRMSVASARDITERRRAESRLRASEATLRRAQTIAQLVSWEYDTASGTVQVFGDAERMLGLTTPTLDALRAMVHRDDQPALIDAARAVLAGTPREIELRATVRGELRWFRMAAALDDAAAPAPARIIGLIGDVTARHQLDDQLRMAQKMEAVGQLAGGIAHDFNNLLTIISGQSELLLPRLTDTSVHADVRAIQDAAESAARLTRQLLAFGRRAVVEPRVLDLNEVVRVTGRMLDRLLGETILLVLDLLPTLDSVRADAGQLEQLLVNLALNARDAMPGGGRVTIRTDLVSLTATDPALPAGGTPGTWVRLRVADTGTGMPDEVKAHLFEPFFTTKDTGRGTGLGLASVFGIVTQAGGGITVDTALGRGTEFTVLLPSSGPRLAGPGAPAPAAVVPRGQETLLLAEDEDGVRRLVTRALEGQGYTVIATASGLRALEAVAAHSGPIHALITDVVMPDMGGRALATRLHETHPDLRVLFMSGYPDDQIGRAGAPPQGMGLLQKPFRTSDLLTRVRALLDAPPPVSPS